MEQVLNPKSLPPNMLALQNWKLELLKREAEFCATHPEKTVMITADILKSRPT